MIHFRNLKHRLHALISALLPIAGPCVLHAQVAGSLDPTFDPNVGGVETLALAFQPDGKILVGGYFSSVSGESRNGMARLNPNGSLESLADFDAGGIPILNVYCVAQKADGKILEGGALGASYAFGGLTGNIARLNPDGSPESLATFNPGSGTSGAPYGDVACVAVQPDGKLIICGYFTSVDGQPRGGIARLHENGSLENTVTFNSGIGANSIVWNAAVQPDGRIVLGGAFTAFDGQPRSGVARLNPNGSLESTTTFNTGAGANAPVRCMALQPDGKILLGGDFTSIDGQLRGGIARLNSDGSLESTATFNPGAGANGSVYSIGLQADGKIVLGGGFTSVGGQPRGRVARLRANGTVESTTTFDAGTGADHVVVLALQPDGGILLGGLFNSVNGQPRGKLARLFNGPATQALTIPSSGAVQWTRGGTSPEIDQVTFDLSTDGGVNWTPLGAGNRIAGGWERTGLSLPLIGLMRARGRTSGGFSNGSSSIIEQVVPMSVNILPVANAGPDQTVNEGEHVVLAGSGSDPEGSILTPVWSQVGGPPVTLDLSDPFHPAFSAPPTNPGGETLTFQLIVSNGLLSSTADVVNITVKNVNHAPVAHAGTGQTVAEGSPVALDGSASFDSDGDTLTYNWTQTAGPVVALSNPYAVQPQFTAPFITGANVTLTFSLAVSDGTDTATATVNVLVDNFNHLPVANAGPDQVQNEGSLTTLDGSMSSDPDSDPLSYQWQRIAGPNVVLTNAGTASPTFTAPSVMIGGETLIFRLTVDDGYGGTATDDVVVAVADLNDPPDCSLAYASPAELGPMNHKLVPVEIKGIADPNNDQIVITVSSITQDEPTTGLGNGDTGPDAVVSNGQILLRAECGKQGDGRVYRINFTVSDGRGGSCNGSVTVSAPTKRKATATDSGQNYDSLQ